MPQHHQETRVYRLSPTLTREVEHEWRDTLVKASLKLLATLIKHYTKVVDEVKQMLEQTISEVTDYLKQIADKQTKETQIQAWKGLKLKLKVKQNSQTKEYNQLKTRCPALVPIL